jgi:hypothetical protein
MDANVNQKVSLGCGTLLLIALIVVIFSNSGTRGLDSEVRKLNTEVQALQSQVNLQNQTLQSMNATLAEIRARLTIQEGAK